MSSNRRPWYKWYPKDFVTDEKVQSLSAKSELIYRRLLDIMWQSNACRLLNDCLRLANTVGRGLTQDEFEKSWKEIQTPGFELFKTTDDGKWIYSKRLLEQLEVCEKRANSGSKGGVASVKAKRKQTSSKLQAKHNQTSTDTDTDITTPIVPLRGDDQVNKNGNYTPLFLRFWSLYPRKVSKGSAWRAWKKIKSPSEIIDQIESAIKNQSISTDWQKDNGQFIPHPATWLNGRRWEDEGITKPEIKREYVEQTIEYDRSSN